MSVFRSRPFLNFLVTVGLVLGLVSPHYRVLALLHPHHGVLTLDHPNHGVLALVYPHHGVLTLDHPNHGVLALVHPHHGVLTLDHPNHGVLHRSLWNLESRSASFWHLNRATSLYTPQQRAPRTSRQTCEAQERKRGLCDLTVQAVVD